MAKRPATWLRDHPEVTVVSRDRQGLYAPQAVQVADHFPLLQNLIQAVEEQLDTMLGALQLASAMVTVNEPPPNVVLAPVIEQTPSLRRTPRSARVQAWFAQVMTLHREGLNNQQIMRLTGVGRRRVETWTRLGHLPERQRTRPRTGMPESFRDYLWQRWQQGCHSGRQLLAEIRPQGYRGGYSGLARVLAGWRTPPRSPAPRPAILVPLPLIPPRHLPPAVAAALLAKYPGELSERQTDTIAGLQANHSQMALLRRFLLRFRALLRGSTVAKLQTWLTDVEGAGLPRLKRFVGTLRRDQAAVENAVTMPWSNGQVEGQVNRLKAIKRQMYGRAGTDLLRARLLPAPAS